MSPPDEEERARLPDAAGRAAFFPARTAARAWREQLEAAVDEVLSAPEIARVIDRALAGPLPEEFARSVVRHDVLQRVVAELASSGELERLLNDALASPRTREMTDQILASDETQRALREIASSPVVREAIAKQTAGLAEEVVGGFRSGAAGLDDRVWRAFHRRERAGRSVYAGVATRAAAFATDVLVITFLHMAAVGVVSLVASLVGGLRPEWLVGALLGVGWFLIAAGYFVLFWSAAGVTPGMRLLRLRVRPAAGGNPGAGRSIVRLIGLVVSIIPMFVGFVPILFDKRRRGLADFLAGTMIVYDTPEQQVES